MAIDSIGSRIPNPANLKPTPTTTHKSTTPATTDTDTVNIQSTDTIKQALADNSAPVNQERVQELKKAIEEGSYSVNAENVAAKLLHIERALSDNS